MAALTVLALLFANIFILASSQECPSAKWIKCADNSDGQWCKIPGHINQGYMSHGSGGRWSLVPFSNVEQHDCPLCNHDDMEIKCGGLDSSGGGPGIVNGQDKYCCYIEADIGINTRYIRGSSGDPPVEDTPYFRDPFRGSGSWDSRPYTWISNEPMMLRWGGESNQYIYRAGYNAWMYCNSGFMGDIKDVPINPCSISQQYPDFVPEISSSDWKLCSNENGDCGGLDTNAPQWIRYGSDGQYYFKLIISHDGKIACKTELFGDPIPGEIKHCYRASNPYHFGDIAGDWVKLTSCFGCSSIEYEYSVGVTQLTQTEITDSWSRSLAKEVSAGISFGPIDAGGSVSTEDSKEISNSMSQAFEQTESKSTTYECEKGNLYQWSVSASSENPISKQYFKVKGFQLACIESGYKPKCIPNHCGDENCQNCINS
mmetsp:Transcript_58038/g.52270  ORF Transcript_58038/g.52270 Transcript_58038/m.52270 type:complete len:429 (+) Transcript_58038:126-1412(+)